MFSGKNPNTEYNNPIHSGLSFSVELKKGNFLQRVRFFKKKQKKTKQQQQQQQNKKTVFDSIQYKNLGICFSRSPAMVPSPNLYLPAPALNLYLPDLTNWIRE